MIESDDKSLPPMPPESDIHAKRSGTTKYYNGTIADKLNFAKRATDSLINNSDIQNSVAVYGYTKEKISQFQTIYNEAAQANIKQQKEYGDKTGAYDDFEKLFKLAKDEFHIISKIAGIAFKNDKQKQDQLGLNLKKKRDLAGIFNGMQKFYNNLTAENDMIQAMSAFGFEQSKIDKFHNGFDKAWDAYNVYFKENTESVEATRVRNQKIEILDDWMMDFYTISKIAFAHRPELLPQIGVM